MEHIILCTASLSRAHGLYCSWTASGRISWTSLPCSGCAGRKETTSMKEANAGTVMNLLIQSAGMLMNLANSSQRRSITKLSPQWNGNLRVIALMNIDGEMGLGTLLSQRPPESGACFCSSTVWILQDELQAEAEDYLKGAEAASCLEMENIIIKIDSLDPEASIGRTTPMIYLETGLISKAGALLENPHIPYQCMESYLASTSFWIVGLISCMLT